NQDIHFAPLWVGFIGAAVNYVGLRPYEFTTLDANSLPLPRQEFPAYTNINLHVGVRYDSWLVNLNINNVANKLGVVGVQQSFAAVAPGGYYATIIQPRTIGLSISKTFGRP